MRMLYMDVLTKMLVTRDRLTRAKWLAEAELKGFQVTGQLSCEEMGANADPGQQVSK